jgi:hypothetical protein
MLERQQPAGQPRQFPALSEEAKQRFRDEFGDLNIPAYLRKGRL